MDPKENITVYYMGGDVDKFEHCDFHEETGKFLKIVQDEGDTSRERFKRILIPLKNIKRVEVKNS